MNFFWPGRKTQTKQLSTCESLKYHRGKKKKRQGETSLVMSWTTNMSLFICWSTYWHVGWRYNLKGTCSSGDISGELVLNIGKASCCCSHCFRWWIHCSFATYPAYAKALRRKHCFLTRRFEHVRSEKIFTSPTVQFCLILLQSLWASFGFQSSFASIQRFSVCLCPCLPNWSPLFHYFANQLHGSEFTPFLNSVQSGGKMPLQRSPDTATGKAQCVKISLKLYTTVLLYSLCILRYQRSLQLIVPSQKTLL